MNECKLQLGCLVIVLFVVLIYYRQYFRYQLKYRFSLFDLLIITAVFSLVMDGVTAYTVNHLDTISHSFNLALHTLFLISLDTVVFVLFLYVLTATYSFPKKRITKIMILLPFSLNIVIVLFGIRSLKFIEGSISNYSMGLSAYTCFVMVGIYTLLTCIVFLKRWNYIGKSKKASIMIYLSIQISATLYQVFLPQALVTSIATTALILGIYLTQEDPAMRELSGYHHEMVMGFASSINLLQVFSFLITLFLMYILYFLLMTIAYSSAFWFIRVSSITEIHHQFVNFSFRIPGVAFAGIWKKIFMCILPYGLIATVPTQIFISELDYKLIIYAIVIDVVFTLIMRFIWNKGMKRYDSASS